MTYFEKMCEDIGYMPITTFWEDFSTADAFGSGAITDTYNRAFKEWKNNYKYFTELVMVLNWKCWEWHYRNRFSLSELYSNLFYKAQEWGYNNLKGDELTYFWRTLD